MIVYVLEDFGITETGFIGIFSTREKAEEAREKYIKRGNKDPHKNEWYYPIDECELDKDYTDEQFEDVETED